MPLAQTPLRRRTPRAVAVWLIVVAALVFAMVVVGGITRLTESGLSITEWHPVSGAIPPLSQADWDTAFAAYKRVPQFAAIHSTMGLSDFKFIFFWEWVHRLLGRIIGLAFAAPLAWFWLRGRIPHGYKPRLLALMVFGGMQGAVGWWMVKSGLFAGEHVSHFRLSVHLLLALSIMAALIWTALDLFALSHGRERRARVTGLAAATGAALFVQIMLGAWVAGMRAGYVASDWPRMNGQWVPEGIDWSRGTLFALGHDPYLVHFVHRWWAWVVVAALFVLARAAKRSGVRAASIAIHAAIGTQVLLGIATVMSGMSHVLAEAHQAVGAMVVAAVVWGSHAIGRGVAAAPASVATGATRLDLATAVRH